MEKIIINKNSSGFRLDKFLAQEFFSYSRGEIVKSIKDEKILVNGKKSEPSYRLKENDEIFFGLEERTETLEINPDVRIDVIFQNPDFIVINKPAGIQVHPDQNEKRNTLVNGLILKFTEIKNVHDDSPGAEMRPGIVHRLDKETSGVLVVARNQEAFSELKNNFQEGKMKKKYIALIYGKLKERKGEIRKPIARAGDYRKQTIASGKTKTKIRPAITKYNVIKEFGNYSLVEVFPKTGRMHQIRIHFASLGTPVVGDKLYGAKNIRKKMPVIGRHLLHAQKLEFSLFGEKFSFQAGLPLDFQEALSRLDGSAKKG